MEGTTTSSQRRKSLTKPTTTTHSTAAATPLASSSAQRILGRRIKLKTASNEEIEGRIYALDRLTNCIALDILFIVIIMLTTHNAAAQQGRKQLSFRIIKISHIKEVLSNQEDAPADFLPINHVDTSRLDARESSGVKNMRQRVAKMGVGVTKEAQDIFDALSKTLPCRWSNDTIVVLDEVLIQPPYDVDSCKANSSSASSLARVKKVLEGERRRLERKQ
ncbi:hypothetical protein O0I10_008647 [Lichtheimia ornata]|uniref:AD domain-containing protein n=1 Tax=Lichtheimia ornata TaxID=688661 RepID=A0AAD7XWU7_9FUNG|nr:uncharacterized protein O0I10_008647 [Lichtheimia ornata]KAJ8655761.1 hypothetical protein O0I10_008647 [Lichtheimia ornata]